MNDEFLANYRIPIVKINETDTKNEFNGSKPTEKCINKDKIKDVASPATLKKAAAKRKFSDSDQSDDKLVMFPGRDPSYPNELNKLIRPLACELCKTQMTSIKSSKDHYESKGHDRSIMTWLKINYTERGLEPPSVKRITKNGPVGPNALHCDLCDISLTSLTHANQHYTGRKHRLMEQHISKPIIANDGRFGIGEQFRKSTQADESYECDKPENNIISNINLISKQVSKNSIEEQLQCNICNISVTSISQMKTHLDGSRHQKKLKQKNLDPDELLLNHVCNNDMGVDNQITILKSVLDDASGSASDNDFSMFRTPSGSYHCSICNTTMNGVGILQQHLQGKKHLKKAASSSSDKSEIIKTT